MTQALNSNSNNKLEDPKENYEQFSPRKIKDIFMA